MNIERLQKAVIDFRDQRDWKKFHNPKDIATAIAIETSELQAPFIWLNPEESLAIWKTIKVAEEVADILNWVLLFCEAAGIKPENHPVEKSTLNPKDIAIWIAVDWGKLQERFLWRTVEESYAISKSPEAQERISAIYGKIRSYCQLLDIDLETVFLKKLEKNAEKYPVAKSKWRNDKYTQL